MLLPCCVPTILSPCTAPAAAGSGRLPPAQWPGTVFPSKHTNTTARLRAYLETHLRPGETAELWNLWVGDGPARAFRFTGPLAALEPDTLEQLSEQAQTCLTIEI